MTDSELFQFKIRIKGKTPAAGNTKDFEITVLLKQLSNFWRTLEMPLMNWEINLSSWSTYCVITKSTGPEKFRYFWKITDAKFYIQVVAMATQNDT